MDEMTAEVRLQWCLISAVADSLVLMQDLQLTTDGMKPVVQLKGEQVFHILCQCIILSLFIVIRY